MSWLKGRDDVPLLARYGADQFVLVSPDEKSEALVSEAQAKLMLSTISLAISSTGWYVVKV